MAQMWGEHEGLVPDDGERSEVGNATWQAVPTERSELVICWLE